MRDHFLDRIYGEFQAYKATVLGYSNAQIFDLCYEIDTIANLRDILCEQAQCMSDRMLARLLKWRNILMELYRQWLKKEDSIYIELEEHVQGEIKKMIA